MIHMEVFSFLIPLSLWFVVDDIVPVMRK